MTTLFTDSLPTLPGLNDTCGVWHLHRNAERFNSVLRDRKKLPDCIGTEAGRSGRFLNSITLRLKIRRDRSIASRGP
jgi:hypothetical protein